MDVQQGKKSGLRLRCRWGDRRLRAHELDRDTRAVEASVEGQEAAAARVLGREAVRHRLRLEAIQRGEKGVYPADPTDGLLLCSEAISIGYSGLRLAKQRGSEVDAAGEIVKPFIAELIARELRVTHATLRMCIRLARLDQHCGFNTTMDAVRKACS